MTTLSSVTLLEDRVLLHKEGASREFPLAYQIHSRLIQTGELARLLSEHLREEAGDAVPAAGTAVRLALPRAWGLVCLELPYTGLEGLAQPIRHLAWEVATAAPEPPEQYLYDYREQPGDGESRVLAIRHSLVQFCRTFCEDFGWRLVEIAAAEDESYVLDLERARAHQEALAQERYTTARRWPRLVLAAALAAGLLGLGAWLLVTLPSRPGDRPAPPRPPVIVSPVARTPAPAPADWSAVLRRLAAVEGRLPDFLTLEAEGLLARLDPGQSADSLSDWVGQPTRPKSQGGTRWLAFATPLSGAGRLEDSSRAAERFTVAALGELPARLGADPGRLILQRRRVDGDSVATRWRFRPDGKPGASKGWSATLFHSLPAATPDTSRAR